MGRETTAEREHARETSCTSILGIKNEFPFICSPVSTSLATVWNQEEFMPLFLLSKNTVWSAG